MSREPPTPCPIPSIEEERVSPMVGTELRDLWRKHYHKAASFPLANAWREGIGEFHTSIVSVNTRIKWRVCAKKVGHGWKARVWGEGADGGYWESHLPDEFTSIDTAKAAAVALARICNHSIAEGWVS